MLIFRQLFDLRSSTYTYLLGDSATAEAVLIDPVFEQAARDGALLRELGLRLKMTLETHVHADHITGAWLLQQSEGSQIGLSALGGAANVDVALTDGDRVAFGDRWLEVRATPGHTNGCVSYVLDDSSMVFSGDALLIRGAGRTDFQQGDAHTLFQSITDRLFTLPPTCLVYPGHDYAGRTSSTIDEERQHNPRIGGERSEDDFVGYMNNLGLSHPKRLAEALPANLRSGRPEQEGSATQPDWAPLIYAYAGFWEVEPHWLEEHSAEVYVLDVRGEDEFTGPLGHIVGAHCLPLDQLTARVAEVPQDRPIVTVCRAGGRSAQAVVLLRRAGFTRLASLQGGMLRWRALELASA